MFFLQSALAEYALGGVLLLLLLIVLIRLGNGFVFIPNDSYGVVERKWSGRPSRSITNGFIATAGGPGFLPDVIRGGYHFFMPFQYRVHRQKLITIRSMGYLFARAGTDLTNGQTLAHWPDSARPEDARSFLERGGQKGPQRMVLRQGTHAINTALFSVVTEDGVREISLGDKEQIVSLFNALKMHDGFEPVVVDGDRIAVVTVQDGPALEQGHIIAPMVGTDATEAGSFHNSFQDIEKFLAAGGRRGKQEQVLVEGTYYINRLFASVEMKPKTLVKIGHVGVVISYAGAEGEDLSGADYKHGQLVARGQRGVWQKPLQPGKYAINPDALLVREVPTTNFQLRWIDGSTDTHNFDANLSEIRLITADAFEPILPLSLVVHIAQEDAPYVLQQFADITKLVDQTLDPMVSAWFKDAAQSQTFLELVSKRAELQQRALAEMRVRFLAYKLNVKEVMIGTPRASPGDTKIEQVLEQLRSRQVALEQIKTYESQRQAAVTERELNETQAIAKQQAALTASKVAIDVANNTAEADLRRQERAAQGIKVTSEAEAARVRISAAAEAERIRTLGDADAARIVAIGDAEAKASAAQIEAYGGAEIALRKDLTQIIANAIVESKQPLVPRVVMGGQPGGQDGLISVLLGSAIGEGGLGKMLEESTPQA